MLDKKNLLAFFKKAYKTTTLYSACLGDDLLIGDRACLFRVPFPGQDWGKFTLGPDMPGTLRIQAGAVLQPVEKPDLAERWERFTALPVVCELTVTEEGHFVGEDWNYPYLPPWACQCQGPEGYFLVNYGYLSLLDAALPFYARKGAKDYRLEALEGWVIRLSERVVWHRNQGQREEKYLPVGYVSPCAGTEGMQRTGPYFKTEEPPEEEPAADEMTPREFDQETAESEVF